MNIFENLENLNVSEECFDEIMGIVEDIINEMNPFTVGKVNALRKKNVDDAVERVKSDPRDHFIQQASKAIDKLHKNQDLSRKYVQHKTGNSLKDIDDVHNFTKKTGEKLIASGGDTSVLDKDTQAAVKDFKKAEDNWAKKNPNKKKTGLVYSKQIGCRDRGGYNQKGPDYETKGLTLDHVK